MQADPAPRILLVTWTPPGDRNVGEIILRDLCALLPEGSLRLCEVSDFPAKEKLYDGIRLDAPDERAWRPLRGRAGGLLNHLRVRTVFARAADRLVTTIAAYAREQRVDRVWITLNSQTLVRIAAPLARATSLPLHALIWDPPTFLARHQGWDSRSERWVASNFDAALRASRRGMVVSDAMRERYSRECRLPCSIVRHAFDPALTRMASPLPADDYCKIGFAGTLYDGEQLTCLIRALDLLGWKLGERPVRLRIVGNYYRFNQLSSPAQIELLGWRSTEATRTLLSECSFSYLPIPFGAYFTDFAEEAFPTKLSTYLAAGRPVLVHAPTNASVARFCLTHRFGRVCDRMQPDVLAQQIQALHASLGETALHAAVEQTFLSQFSREVMRANFAEFIGVDASTLRP
jgi:hypothetical protein